MTFKEESVKDFLAVFETSKKAIGNFEGCTGLKLLRDIHQPHVYFTYSYWNAEENLNDYRNSRLFKETWANTKILFKEKPAAWSVELMDQVK